MKANEADILVANTSAVLNDNGTVFRIVKGKTTAHRGSRIVKGREHLFTPLVVDFDMSGGTPRGRKKSVATAADDTVEAFPVDAPAVPEPPQAAAAPAPEPAKPVAEKPAPRTRTTS